MFQNSLSVDETIRRGRALDDEGLYGIEEPVRSDDYTGCARVAREVNTPICIGENRLDSREMQKAIDAGAAAHYVPDVQRIGGVTGWPRPAAGPVQRVNPFRPAPLTLILRSAVESTRRVNSSPRGACGNIVIDLRGGKPVGLEIRPLSDLMAAEAIGIDLRAEVTSSERDALLKAVTDHLVLCVRDQRLAPAELAEASRLFGPLKQYLVRKDWVDGIPEVSVVSNRPPAFDGKPQVVASHWHTDDSYLAEPATLTLMHAITLPGNGGDTEFINCYAVLDALPAALRRRIDGLRAVHVYRSRRNRSDVAKRTEEEREATPDVDHPLVRTHPLSGRKALYINPNRIDRVLGWDDDASDALLDPLYEFAFQPRFQYRHRWRPGDLVIWDNRCTMHRANADYDLSQLRVMHRVMLQGEVPV